MPARHVSTLRLVKKGFTLIELAVVITIIAILAGLAINLASGALDRGQVARAQAYWDRLKSASALYVSTQARSPSQFTDFVSPSTTITGPTHTIALMQEPEDSGLSPCVLGATTIVCDLGGEVGVVTYTLESGSVYASNTGAMQL